MDSEGVFLIKAVGNCLGTLENTNFTFWFSSDVQVLCAIQKMYRSFRFPVPSKLLVVYLKARYENELFIHTQTA